MNEIEQAKEIIYTIMKSYHLTELGARICAIAYVSPEPVCLEELAQETKYSLASISNTVKFLTKFYILEKVKKPGTKKVFVTTNNSPIDMLKAKTTLALETEVKPIKEKFPELIKNLEGKKKFEKELILLKKHYEGTLQLEKVMHELNIILERVK